LPHAITVIHRELIIALVNPLGLGEIGATGYRDTQGV
jgi:hypothetical protein